MKFCHLHLHSQYSLLDGLSRITDIPRHVKGLGMSACALSDHGTLYGSLAFYRACVDAGVKPLLAMEAYIAPASRFPPKGEGGKGSAAAEMVGRGNAAFHLTLLAKNNAGWKNLIRLASIAQLEGFYYVPRIDKEVLEAHAEGLICLSGCASSEFSRLLLAGKVKEAEGVAAWYSRVFGKHYYVECQNNGVDIQLRHREMAVDLADRMGLPLVATSDAHYLKREDAVAHDLLVCVNTGRKRDDKDRMRYGGAEIIDQFHVCSPAEMYERFRGLEHAVARSAEIADGVDVTLDFKARHFPVYPLPAKEEPWTAESYLRHLCAEGMRWRYPQGPPQDRQDRLARELGVVCSMGFAGYFLVVWDLVRFARERGIMCGARGSAAGAIISYVLALSHIDPIDHGLLFERFLDPSRGEAPDIDIDFAKDRREEVIAYARQRYGRDHVAQIGTFGSLKGRAALRDVARALDIPLNVADAVAKLVPGGANVTLGLALRARPELAEAQRRHPEWFALAQRVEGAPRQPGTHAAGVVICPVPVCELAPVQVIRGKNAKGAGEDRMPATQWAMEDIEKSGLLKVDVLSLKTFTVIRRCLALVEEGAGERIDLYALPDGDPEAYALYERGDLEGVFQCEEDGMQKLVARIRPRCIADISAAIALYRPGPLESGMADDYVERRHGRKPVPKVHPILDEILADTFAVIVYQESVMQIMHRLGGIELTRAYTAGIKGISKKKQHLIDPVREDFVAGCVRNGLAEEKAREVFGQIVLFAGYSFNQCLSGSTVITEAATGERTTVGELCRSPRPFTLHAIGPDWKLRPRPVTGTFRNGVATVYRLQTRMGSEVVTTDRHRFLTPGGWKELSSLRQGDWIACPRHLVTGSSAHWGKGRIALLARLLADGNLCHPSTVYYIKKNQDALDEVVGLANTFPNTAAVVKCWSENKTPVVVIGRGPRGKPGPCGVMLWVRSLGLHGKKATAKFVPRDIFLLPEEDIALFLGRLWAGDGCLGNNGCGIYYASSSRQFADDVRHLLLRIGITSTIRQKRFAYRGGHKIGYTVLLSGDGASRLFLKVIGPHMLGREKDVERAASRDIGDVTGTKDVVPVSFVGLLDEACESLGVTWNRLRAMTDGALDARPQPEGRRRGWRRTTIRLVAELSGSEQLRDLAASDVIWDCVTSIEAAGEEEVFDLEVEGDHSYVANDIIVHNSHSAAYAQISYHTAWLKAHHPVCFAAALLDGDSDNTDRLAEHVRDVQAHGLEVLPPCVNASGAGFGVEGGKVRYGLAAVKGVGADAARAVERERLAKGPYADLFALCRRVPQLNKVALEALIGAGALDCLPGHRAALAASMDAALAHARASAKSLRSGQGSLFGDEDAGAAPPLAKAEPWAAAREKKAQREALGFLLSGGEGADVSGLAGRGCGEVATLPAGALVVLAGALSDVRVMPHKAPKRHTHYARVKLRDPTGEAEGVVWGDVLQRCRGALEVDEPCVLRCAVEGGRGGAGPSLVVRDAWKPAEAAAALARRLRLDLDAALHGPDVIDALAALLRKAPGRVPVTLAVAEGGLRVELAAGEGCRVDPAALDGEALSRLLGPGRTRWEAT